MLITRTWTTTTLIATLAGLVLAQDVRPASRMHQAVDDDEAHLADVLRNLEVENLSRTAAGQPRSRQETATLRFTVDLPNGTSVVLESSDPGTVLTDARALETVAGNQVFNRFDIPQLRGINATAPYFHDHRAKTLEEVVKHYQAFFFFINVVRGLPLPLIADEDLAPIVAHMKKAF